MVPLGARPVNRPAGARVPTPPACACGRRRRPGEDDRVSDPSTPVLPPEVTARWQARFRAPRVSLPGWADDAPHRCLYTSDVSGVVEQYAWDRESDRHRQATDRPTATSERPTSSPAG